MTVERRASLLAAFLAFVVGATPDTLAQDRGRVVVPVPRSTIYPGDGITAAMLTEVPVSKGHSGIHSATETLVGRIARRTLIAGEPIALDAVRLPFAVQQGQGVLLVLEAEGLRITVAGEAMQSGAVGETVAVRNADTGAVVRARVRDARTAVLEAP